MLSQKRVRFPSCLRWLCRGLLGRCALSRGATKPNTKESRLVGLLSKTHARKTKTLPETRKHTQIKAVTSYVYHKTKNRMFCFLIVLICLEISKPKETTENSQVAKKVVSSSQSIGEEVQALFSVTVDLKQSRKHLKLKQLEYKSATDNRATTFPSTSEIRCNGASPLVRRMRERAMFAW